MSLEIARRVKALEARVAELEKKLAAPPLATAVEIALPARSLCPKCGVKPNHFFHVKNCRGQQQKNDDRNRDPGIT